MTTKAKTTNQAKTPTKTKTTNQAKTPSKAKNTKKDSTVDLSEYSLDHKISMLDKMIEWFYSENFTLDEALYRYETAAELVNAIDSDLKHLKNNIEIVRRRFDQD